MPRSWNTLGSFWYTTSPLASSTLSTMCASYTVPPLTRAATYRATAMGVMVVTLWPMPATMVELAFQRTSDRRPEMSMTISRWRTVARGIFSSSWRMVRIIGPSSLSLRDTDCCMIR